MFRYLILIVAVNSWFSYAQDTTFHDGNELSYSISTDTATTYLEHYLNGNLKRKVVYFHPEGQSSYEDLEKVKRLESDYDENGQIASKIGLLNNDLNGDYLMYDDSSFVTHLVFRNDSLVDVINMNCCFVDQKGEVISKDEFFNQLYTNEFGKWHYYLFEDYPPFSDISCYDFMIHSDKYNSFSYGKEVKKLVKRLSKYCL